MRFFTPDLYIRTNSSDDSVADGADDDWEQAIDDYHTHLKSIRGRTAAVDALSRKCFHDWEVLSVESSLDLAAKHIVIPVPPLWVKFAIVSLHLDSRVVNLLYSLSDSLWTEPTPEGWPPFYEPRLWLYDEVDVGPTNDSFVHRVLLSDGTELVIPFSTVTSHEFSLTPTAVPATA